MRAVVFDIYGAADVLHEVLLPIPAPAIGQVRIRVTSAAVNPADVKWRAGMFRDIAPVPLPHILGYDVAGTIDAVGADVTGFASGDRVIAMLDPVSKGGYADYALADAAAVAHCPDELIDEVAAALPTAGLTGFQLIERHVRPLAGETVLITGATGAVGRFAVRAALDAGAHVIAAVRPSHRDAALALGVNVVPLDGTEVPPLVDHVADTVGGSVVATLSRKLRPGGRIRTVATTPIDADGLKSAPVFISVQPDGAMLARIAQRVAAGEIAVPIDRSLPLAQAATAHRLIEGSGITGKIILLP